MARSGTTWLAELICSQLPCRLMFEPFNGDLVPEYQSFAYQQYQRPESDNPALQAFVERIVEGRIRNPWIDRQVESLRPRRRVVKAVRASLLLGWITRRYPQVPILLIIRHPCANVASFLRLEWSCQRDLDSILRQPELIADHLAPYMDVIDRARAPHQRLALLWSILHLVPLRQRTDAAMPAFHYEDLVGRPNEMVPKVFDALGIPFGPSVFERLRRPSSTVERRAPPEGRPRVGSAWRAYLGPARVDDVLEVVHAFGLGHLYDDDGHPIGRL
jgi:hypothetical protein